MSIRTGKNWATNTPTHFFWCDRWIPASECEVETGEGLEPAWEFDNGRDACDWLAFGLGPSPDREKGS